MLICIAGKNSIATNALIHSIKLFGADKIIVCPNPSDDGVSRWQPSLRRYAHELGIKIVTIDQIYDIKDLIFVSLEYEKIVLPEKFSTKQLFNIHFSKLPSYKGMYTSAWPILNGEDESGITLHQIDRGIDTGEIIDQQIFKLSNKETARSLYFKYLKNGFNLFDKNIEKLVNKKFKLTPQSHHQSSYFSKNSIDYANIKINLNNTAEKISQELRAFTFREFQLPTIENIKVGAHKITPRRSSKKPGTLTPKANGWTLSTIDYDLFLEQDSGDIFFDWLDAPIENKPDIFLKKNQCHINLKNRNGWSPLMISTFKGDLIASEKLISMGASINDTNSNGTTPLMYAKDFCVRSSNFNLCKFLIESGANPNQLDFFGKNVLDYAILNKQTTAINFFKKYI
jgi:methionyl-tRNA formyltransferase